MTHAYPQMKDFAYEMLKNVMLPSLTTHVVPNFACFILSQNKWDVSEISAYSCFFKFYFISMTAIFNYRESWITSVVFFYKSWNSYSQLDMNSRTRSPENRDHLHQMETWKLKNVVRITNHEQSWWVWARNWEVMGSNPALNPSSDLLSIFLLISETLYII